MAFLAAALVFTACSSEASHTTELVQVMYEGGAAEAAVQPPDEGQVDAGSTPDADSGSAGVSGASQQPDARGGAGGTGGVGGSAGATSDAGLTCKATEKVCAGYCREKSWANGCDSTSCQTCPEGPPNSDLVCRASGACDFTCVGTVRDGALCVPYVSFPTRLASCKKSDGSDNMTSCYGIAEPCCRTDATCGNWNGTACL